MADLTILSPQPLVYLSLPSSDVSARRSSRARSGHGPISNHPASSQYDPSFLSPPLDRHRAPRGSRQSHSHEEVRSSHKELRQNHDEEESATVESDGEEDPYFSRGPSYTTSFRPFAYSSTNRATHLSSNSQSGLRPPAPPLFRPKTFWRHTRRSALTGPSYSPSSYIVRRSTFIAAGLSLDTPHADLSALSVELRTGTISLVPSTALPL